MKEQLFVLYENENDLEDYIIDKNVKNGMDTYAIEDYNDHVYFCKANNVGIIMTQEFAKEINNIDNDIC